MLRDAGINEIELTKSEATTMFPDLDLEECDYFAFEPESGYADPVATAGVYASKARELGAEILLRNEVEKLEFEGEKVSKLLLQDGTRIKCAKVILCTNVWTNHLLERSGVREEQLTSNKSSSPSRRGLPQAEWISREEDHRQRLFQQSILQTRGPISSFRREHRRFDRQSIKSS